MTLPLCGFRACSDGELLPFAWSNIVRARPLVHALIKGFDGFIGGIACCSNDLNGVVACCLSRKYHRVHGEPAANMQCVSSSQLCNLVEIPGIALGIEFYARCQPSPVVIQLLFFTAVEALSWIME
jgi:hypothetical protein